MIQTSSSVSVYPPNVKSCPDYWTSDGLGKCSKPINAYKDSLNSTDISNSHVAPYSKDGISFDSTDILWASEGSSAICAQKKWAQNKNIIWDGVTDYNKC